MGKFLEMTSAEFRTMLLEGDSPYRRAPLVGNKSKYNNKKTERGGFVYDSRKEANRGDELMSLRHLGKIRNLERQKPFVLVETFEYHGKTIRGVKWVADFYYFDVEKNIWVAEDVKSNPTKKKPEYIIKKKLFMLKYPEILFQEII